MILFFIALAITFIYTYREIKRLDEKLDKLFCQIEQFDEIKPSIYPSQFQPLIKDFKPEKPETLRPNTVQGREVESQVFEFDVKK
jgi:hypothetical protein